MYRRDVCIGEKLAAGECEDAKGEILNERLLLKGEECIFYGICS